MTLIRSFVSIGACALILTTSVVRADLQGRLPATPGGTDWRAVYDTDRDITWIANGNLAATNTFGLLTATDLGTHPSANSTIQGRIESTGAMNFPGAFHFIDAMNAAGYLGFDDWRLPAITQPDETCSAIAPANPPEYYGLGCLASELGHLFYTEFGATGGAIYPNGGGQDRRSGRAGQVLELDSGSGLLVRPAGCLVQPVGVDHG